jgi:hypothetical protein
MSKSHKQRALDEARAIDRFSRNLTRAEDWRDVRRAIAGGAREGEPGEAQVASFVAYWTTGKAEAADPRDEARWKALVARLGPPPPWDGI